MIESGSTDDSGERCDRVAETHERIRVIHEGARNGYGAAMRLGYADVTCDLVWLVTVDTPFPLESILAAVPLFDQHDCVLSYRSDDPRSIARRLQSLVYNIVVRTLLRLRMRHVNSAFKVYKREMIQALPLQSAGWFLDAEVLYWISRRKIPYAVLPVPLIDRETGESSVGAFAFLAVLRELFEFLRSPKS